MPVYNGERFLRKAIDSVLAQKFTDFEIVICDDCSSDGSVGIIESYDDPRITLYRNERNLGLVGNWNNAIAHSSGKYVKIMMQDDILGPDALDRQTSLMENNPQATLSIGNTMVININDEVIMKRIRFKADRIINGKKYAKRSLRGRNIFCEPPNYLFRRDSFEKVERFDDSVVYTPDWDMCVSLCEIGDVACTEAEVMRFRVSDTQETSKIYRGKNAVANQDSDKMFIKHLKSGILGLNRFDYFLFRTVIRLAAFARVAVLGVRKKK